NRLPDPFDQPIVVGFFPNISMDNAGNAVVAYQTVNQGGSGQFFNTWDISVDRMNSSGNVVSIKSITSTGIGVGSPLLGTPPPFPSTTPDIALDPNGTGMYVVSFNTRLLGIPSNRTVQIDEVNGADNIFYAYNFPGFPNNNSSAVSLDGSGNYML